MSAVQTPSIPKPKTGARRRAHRTETAKPAPTRRRVLVTPEGVDLGIEIATGGARAAAFILDCLIIVAVLIGFSLLVAGALAMTHAKAPEALLIIWLLGAFVLQNFWFTVWEMRAAGATPGKRIMGTRVAMRNGGRLTAHAIFARNAMRQIEIFLPISMLFTGAGDYGPWGWVAGIVWCGVFALLPLFNRDRLRAGDLIAGTWVIEAPRRRLAPDLAAGSGEKLARYAFTLAQLQAYGVMELQVLEDVLRRRDRKTMTAVALRIRTKIGWTSDSAETDADFLSAYYAGLRGRLEQRLLFGHRRRDKHDKA